MEEKSFPMVRVFNVFNIDQINGLSDELSEDHEKKLPCVEDFIKLTGVKLVPGSPAFVPGMNWCTGQDTKPVWIETCLIDLVMRVTLWRNWLLNWVRLFFVLSLVLRMKFVMRVI